MKRLAVVLFVLLGMVWASPTAAQFDITARVTVDNSYAFGWGDANSILPNNYWPLASTGNLMVTSMMASDIYSCTTNPPPFQPVSGPELYPNIHPTILDFLYIVVRSDESARQGAIGDFTDNNSGRILLTGNPHWEVFATGVPVSQPTLAQVNAQIAIANANAGAPATSSVGWVRLTPTAGRVGRLVVTPQGGSLASLPCLDPGAQWMWYLDDQDPRGTGFNPFTMQPQSPGRSREFLIFRLPVGAFVSDYDLEATKSACRLMPGVTAYGLNVTNVGQPIKGPAQIQILDLVSPGLTVAVAVTPPWQCTPMNTVGPDVITCTYNVPLGTTIPTGAALPPITISATGDARCPNCMRARLYLRGHEGELSLMTEANAANNVSCREPAGPGVPH